MLFFLVFALGFIQCESKERKASLVILPPLVLGYDELSFERDDVAAVSSKPPSDEPATSPKARRAEEELDKVPEIKLDRPPVNESENTFQKITEKPPEWKSGKPSEKPPTVKPTVKRSKREPPTKPSELKKGRPLKKVARKNKKKIVKKGRIGFVKPKAVTKAEVRRTNEEPAKPSEIKPNKPSKKTTEKPMENKLKKTPKNKLGKQSEKSPSLKSTVKLPKRDPPKKPPTKKGKPLKKVARKNKRKINIKGS